MSRYEYYGQSDATTFNISDKIVSEKDKNTFLIKITFKELLQYSDSWSFNRRIDDTKTQELYETLCEGYDIPWTLSAIYDTTIASAARKILILDGQHRKQAINMYLKNFESRMTFERNVWIWMFHIDFSETTNSNAAVNLFKKINNNRVFEKTEIPNTIAIDIVKMICENDELKQGIKTNDKFNTSHSPYIHRKELNAIINENIDVLADMSSEEIIQNMIVINNIIKEYYKNKASNDVKLQKAEKDNFFLNMGKKSKYPITKWIRYISNPNAIKDF